MSSIPGYTTFRLCAELQEARTALQPLESYEEIFVLPHSNDIDEEEDVAYTESPGAVEKPLSFAHAFESGFGEYFIHILSTLLNSP
jgi:hypothetical protein